MSEEVKKEDEVTVDPNKNKEKVKFDEDQTKVVNKLYNDAFKSGAEKVEAEKARVEAEKTALAAAKAALEAEIAELKAKTTDKKEEKKDDPNSVQNEALEMIKAQMAEMQGIVGAIKSERDQLKAKVELQEKEQRKAKKKDLFLDAVAKTKINFFDPLEAYKLAEDDGYEYDAEADRAVIKNKATGTFKLNENAEPMTVIDYVKDFAKRKNYLVQAPNAGGIGAGEQRKIADTKDPNEVDFNNMTNDEFEKYRSKVMNKAAERN